MDVHDRTAANRRRLADFFDGLDAQQLATPSLCGEWTVQDVLGHLVAPLEVSNGAFLRQLVRARGSFDRANSAVARNLARRPREELTATLRAKADVRFSPPVIGPMGQFADGCVHLRDCARPLGLADDVGVEDWTRILDWVVGGVPGLVPKKRAAGLTLRATDQERTWGSGSEVVGTTEALALAIVGRPVVLDELEGPGAAELRARLTS